MVLCNKPCVASGYCSLCSFHHPATHFKVQTLDHLAVYLWCADHQHAWLFPFFFFIFFVLFCSSFEPSGSYLGHRSTKCSCLPHDRKSEEEQRNGKVEWIWGRTEKRQGEARRTERTNNSSEHIVYCICQTRTPPLTNTHTHSPGATHMLKELAERKGDW